MKSGYTENLIQDCEWLEEEEKEVVLFGVRQGKNMFNSILVTIFIGIVMNIFWESLLFLICFIPLRRFAGGFHARTKALCLTISIITVIISFAISKRIWQQSDIILWISTISFCLIYNMSPVENKKRLLDVKEKASFGTTAKVIAFIEFLIMLILMHFAQYRFAAIIAVSFLVVNLGLLVGWIFNNW